MRILHCADLHLDSAMTTHLSAEQARERRNELLLTFLRMVDYAAEQGVSVILIAGDLFDRDCVSTRARETVLGAMRAHPSITFFYLQGNHDALPFPGEGEEAPENLVTFSERWRRFVLLQRHGRRVVLYGRESGPAGAAAPERGQEVFSPRAQDLNLVLLHGQLSRGGSWEQENIPLSALEHRSIDYAALGHLHRHSEGRLDGRGIYVYPGCLEGRGYDECGEHGFVLLQIDEEELTLTHHFVPFASRIFTEVRVDVSGCGSTSERIARVQEALQESFPDPDRRQRDFCRLVLEGRIPVESESGADLIAQHFAPQFYGFSLRDETQLVVDAAQYAGDISLKGEFVRLLESAEELDERERAQVIRCGLQALGGEEIGR